MKQLLRAIDTVNRRVGLGMSFLLLAMAGMTLYEVIARFGFNSPTIWAHKVTRQVFGFYAIMAGGYVLLLKAHIRVDVFWNMLSPRNKAIADLCTSMFAFLFVTMLLWRVGIFAWDSLLLLEHSYPPFSIPVFPLKITMIIGALLLFLQLIAKFIRDLYLAITGAEYA